MSKKYVKLKCDKCGHVTHAEANWMETMSEFSPAEMCEECCDYGYKEVGESSEWEFNKFHDINQLPPIDFKQELKELCFNWGCLFWILFFAICAFIGS